LFGQRTSGAAFVFDNKGPNILCEGYATALSVRAVMKALKRRYTLHVCFSAGNMKKIAATLQGGFVVADNDQSRTGEKTAQEIGWPYWMPDDVGMDANDAHQRDGLFKFSQSIGKIIR
jgi:putative DNA primase/helicase